MTLEELKATLAAMTPANEWFAYTHEQSGSSSWLGAWRLQGPRYSYADRIECMAEPDAHGIVALRNHAAELIERLERAKEALKPFAEYGRPCKISGTPNFHDLEDDICVATNSGLAITAGDCRNANAVLSELSKPLGER